MLLDSLSAKQFFYDSLGESLIDLTMPGNWLRISILRVVVDVMASSVTQ